MAMQSSMINRHKSKCISITHNSNSKQHNRPLQKFGRCAPIADMYVWLTAN